VFKVQLRALARAAADGPLEVMVPMVTRPEELATVKVMLAAEVEALLAAGKQARMPALGMMVEVPAAALRAAEFDTHFYSIGTNDLVQYTMAAARDDAAVADLLDMRDPAVLRLIREVAEAGRRASRKVAVCGDAASDPGLTSVLLDAGVNVLSVTPAALDHVRAAIEAHREPAA
jgi:phosphotransferase system enzyme I (PtsI)